jgi:hypothetical protein
MAEELKYPCSPRNPYDYSGSAHNFLVHTLIKKYNAELLEVRSDFRAVQDTVIQRISEIGESTFANTGFSFLSEVPGTDGLFAKANFDDYPALVNQTAITGEAKAIIIEYLGQLFNLPLDSNEAVNRFTDTVREFENSYQPSDDATDKAVLSALATAKYSAYLWQEVRNSGGGGTASRGVRWGCVAGDIIGAIGSGLVGAAAASAIVWYCFYD